MKNIYVWLLLAICSILLCGCGSKKNKVSDTSMISTTVTTSETDTANVSTTATASETDTANASTTATANANTSNAASNGTTTHIYSSDGSESSYSLYVPSGGNSSAEAYYSDGSALTNDGNFETYADKNSNYDDTASSQSSIDAAKQILENDENDLQDVNISPGTTSR